LAEIKNPNQQGGSDMKSLLIPMIVMVGVLGGLQFYRSKHTQPLQPPAQQQAPQAQSAPPATPSASAAPVATASASPTATPAVVGTAEQTTVIENQLYRIEFTNRGAQVKSWILKREKDRNGAPLDLVHSAAAREFGAPLSLTTYDSNLTTQLRQALYVPSVTGSLLAPQTLTFTYVANGLDVKKTFRFDETYLIHADVIALRNGAPVRALLAWPGGFGDQDQQLDYNGSVLESMSEGKAEHVAFAKVSGGGTLNAPLDYVGVSDQFFTALFLPDQPSTATAITLHGTIDVEKLKRSAGPTPGASTGKVVTVPIIGAGLGDVSGHLQARVYAGPKSYTALNTITTTGGQKLSPVVDFGFFAVVGKPMFFALHFVQEHVASNWGWAIVVFTILINVVLLPLRIMSMKSALKMQRLQPQMDAIKARYAKYKVTDPKRSEMNAEIMQLQKDNGVNMFGGCIPTLIQLPLLIAMFSMLQKVVELRQSHWFWLHDLTAADPYHILPIVMVISSFLVQFYMPSPGVDPQQQKMMAFMMPAFSGYMTWNYSSGLALYWCVGNVIMIIQQYVMNKTSLGQEMRAIAAKRARRKSPQTIQGRK
jgi:YidC/Oxa1 family membrane protein insertase